MFESEVARDAKDTSEETTEKILPETIGGEDEQIAAEVVVIEPTSDDKNEENIFDFQLFEILPQSITERFYTMQREGQDTKKIASDIKEKIVAVIDKLFSATIKRTQTLEDIQRNASDIYRDHLSDKYFYNEIMNAFYTIDTNGIFQIISSDEIFFAVRDKIPTTLQPLTLWRTLKQKIKSRHWLEFSPSMTWIERCIEFCEGLVESYEEAKFLLFTLGCIIHCSTNAFEFTTLWMGDEEVARRAMVFLHRLCSQYVGAGTNRLWANVKFLYKPSFPPHSLAFICFKSSSISHAISVIDNHAATFLCCAKKYAEIMFTKDLSREFSYVFRMHKFQSTDVSSLFEYFVIKYVKDVSEDVHLVHMNEVRQEFSAFLEKEKFPANIVSNENLKRVVLKTLRHSANNFYFGSLQIPSMYSQFLHFCQDCIHLTLDHPLVVPKKKKTTIGRIYKVYKSWHQQKYSAVLNQTEDENEKLSDRLLYQRVIEQFFEFKYGERMDEIELSEPGDIPMHLPETIAAAVADEIEALVHI